MMEIKSDRKGAYYVEHDRRTNFQRSLNDRTYSTKERGITPMEILTSLLGIGKCFIDLLSIPLIGGMFLLRVVAPAIIDKIGWR